MVKKSLKKIKEVELSYSTKILEEMRSRTYEQLKERDDACLVKVVPYGNSIANHYHLWFHVYEDEINHRGQINWIRKRIKT